LYQIDTVFCGVTLARVASKKEKAAANDGKNTIHGKYVLINYVLI